MSLPKMGGEHEIVKTKANKKGRILDVSVRTSHCPHAGVTKPGLTCFKKRQCPTKANVKGTPTGGCGVAAQTF